MKPSPMKLQNEAAGDPHMSKAVDNPCAEATVAIAADIAACVQDLGRQVAGIGGGLIATAESCTVGLIAAALSPRHPWAHHTTAVRDVSRVHERWRLAASDRRTTHGGRISPAPQAPT